MLLTCLLLLAAVALVTVARGAQKSSDVTFTEEPCCDMSASDLLDGFIVSGPRWLKNRTCLQPALQNSQKWHFCLCQCGHPPSVSQSSSHTRLAAHQPHSQSAAAANTAAQANHAAGQPVSPGATAGEPAPESAMFKPCLHISLTLDSK